MFNDAKEYVTKNVRNAKDLLRPRAGQAQIYTHSGVPSLSCNGDWMW